MGQEGKIKVGYELLYKGRVKNNEWIWSHLKTKAELNFVDI